MIWVDADAAPRAVKEMLYRASDRTGVPVVLVANQWFQVPRSDRIELMVVGRGFDVADEYIVDQVEPGDLVITSDIPLAAAVVKKGALCVDPRGQVIDVDNAEAVLARRNVLDMLRASGVEMGGPKAYSDRDKRKFAGILDRWLEKGTL